uniref:Dicer-like protein01 n=1 Tax=Stentor coeruleus TaxID=5963 RepID=A0A060BK71_9CILI|nr:dicer-like protein01 [Stentor coeruleus]
MDSDSEDTDEFDIEDLKPRTYQLEILQQAIEKNIIAFLDTGTGKTLIALMLMKEIAGKSAFLAPVRILVKQQSIAATKLSIANISIIGETADKWEFHEWQASLARYQSFFMTPELFLNTLRSGYLGLEQFKLIVFDECHHCTGSSSYMKIMTEFYHTGTPTSRPKILGLTASPIGHSKSSKQTLRSDLEKLCSYMDCSFLPLNREEVQFIANDPKFEVIGVPISKKVDLKFVLDIASKLPNQTLEGEGINKLLVKTGTDLIDLIGKKALNVLFRDLGRRVENEICRDTILNFEIEGQYSVRFEYLIDILKKHFSYSGGQVIVLAQKRITAWYLAECINTYSLNANLPIKAEKLVGKMTKKFEMGILKISDTKQKEIIQDFKDKKFNVLVSTTVAEEGLDIPSCDLVIRFDSMSTNLRSYVQSKGRARDQDSRFIILTSDEQKSETEELLRRYNETLKFIKDLADTQIVPNSIIKPLEYFQVPSEDLLAYQSFLSIDAPNFGARVCSSWSVDFLENFSKSLNKDGYENHRIIFLTKHYNPGESSLKVSSTRGGCMCIVKFPKILNIKEITSTNLHSIEQKAKEDAALQAVKMLYDRGYLSKHLKPIWNTRPSKAVIELDDPQLELIDEKGTKLRPKAPAADSKQTTILPQDLCLYSISGTSNSEYYIYNIQSTPRYPIDSEYSMGVLIPMKLDTCPFKIYPLNIFKYTGVDLHTEYHENCRNCQKYPYIITPELLFCKKFSVDELYALKLFHLIINAGCKGKYKNLMSAYVEKSGLFKSPEIPVCFIPIKDSVIDFNLVRSINEYFLNDCLGKDPSYYSIYPGCVVRSRYLKDFYVYIREVPNGLDYEFEDKHFITTVKKYYESKYEIFLQSPTIYEVKSLGNYRQAIRPRVQFERKTDTVFLPSEQTDVFPLPTELFIWSKLSPNIFHKLNQSFLTSALNIALNMDFSHNILIEAITCGSSLEGVDYQRFEILGDTVLKFLSSEYLYHKHKEAFEGLLTKMRMDLASNQNLFKKAVEMKIYKFMQARVFNTKNWNAQGLEKILDGEDIENSSDEEDLEDFYEEIGWEKLLEENGYVRIEPRKDQVELSNKQLADCIEALIGAAYTQGGIPLAKKLLKNMHLIKDIPQPKISDASMRDLSELEMHLCYQFSDINLLEEALTHSTSGKEYDYNRLEFLGDALIDFYVLEYFMKNYTKAGPGSLSKMKSTAVSNRTFSYVAYELKLHQHIRYYGNEIGQDLNKFVSNIEKLGGINNLNKLPETGIKIMGDLFESLVAAIYLDSNDLEFCKSFVIDALKGHLERLNPDNCNTHPHNRLFDFAQKHKKTLGNIKIERFKFENRSKIEFVTKISIQEHVVAEGRGPSKLSSSENAAEVFFKRFSSLDN